MNDCPSGKHPYPNRGAAKTVLSAMRLRRHGTRVQRGGAEKQVYRCPFCRCWHLTSVRSVAHAR